MIILKFKWWDDGSSPDTLDMSPVEVHYNGNTRDWMLGSAIAWLQRNGYQPLEWSQDGLVSEIKSPLQITRHIGGRGRWADQADVGQVGIEGLAGAAGGGQ